ncbi:MAG: hypothetical protein LBD55_08245 [Treponema sp.]|nr:hypothetical protein [Treponema sp.]
MKSKVLSGMSGLMLAFALILTGCGDSGGGDDGGDGGGSFSVTGAPVYTATSSGGGIYTISSVQYSGPVLQITGTNYLDPSISIGNIGSISADGKLTLNLPANPPESYLADAPVQYGVSAKLLSVSTTPRVALVKSGIRGNITLLYADRDDPGSSNFPSLKKGWQYLVGGTETLTVITDPSAAGYKWVVYQESGNGNGGSGNNGGGSFSVTGAPVYTATYSGSNSYIIGPRYSGQAYQLTGMSEKSNGSTISIGNIGSISGDGKLTLNLPANPPENALVDVQDELAGSAKLLSLNINLTIGRIVLTKSYFTGSCNLVYVDRDISPGTNNSLALKKGWQYVTGGGGMAPAASHTIPEGFQWAVYQESGNGGGGPFSVTGAPIYTATGSENNYSIGAAYTGTGVEQPITAMSVKPDNSTISIGNIGSISADGKLTVSLPANPPENALFDTPAQWGVSIKMLRLSTNPRIALTKGGDDSVGLIYADRDTPGNSNFPALKKGWQYITFYTSTVIPDPIAAGYKWVLIQGN